MPESEMCALSACGREAFTGGLCAQHYLTSGLAGTTEPDGRLRCTDLDLSGARFEDVTLTRITFGGETRFDRCAFAGEVRFENCAFTGYLSFIEATAERLAFRECRFAHIVDLAGTEFGDLSIRRSEFEAPVELKLGPGTVDMHLTTFAGRSRLVGDPERLDLRRVAFPGGAQLRLMNAAVQLHDVEFGAPSSLAHEMRHLLGFSEMRIPGVPKLLHVAGTDLARLSVAFVDLSKCGFVGAHNLDGFDIDSLEAFSWAPRGLFTRRRVIWDEVRLRSTLVPKGRRSARWRTAAGPVTWETNEMPRDAGRIATDYRALRKAREDAKDEPGAADFYYGEMEMRRLSRRWNMRMAWGRHGSGKRTVALWLTAATEHTLLWLYWAVSGYGLRAWRALTALVVVLLGASVILRYAGFPDADHTYAASLRFAIQSAMSLLRGTDEPLTPAGEWVALALRLLGPLLFGLALLAMRGRVRR